MFRGIRWRFHTATTAPGRVPRRIGRRTWPRCRSVGPSEDVAGHSAGPAHACELAPRVLVDVICGHG